MEQLIKITSVPMRTVRYTQNARLVSSDSLDLERRKALARQMSFHRNHASGGSALPVEDITRINQTFSRHTVTPKMQNMSQQQVAFKKQAQPAVPKTASYPAPKPVASTRNMSSMDTAAAIQKQAAISTPEYAAPTPPPSTAGVTMEVTSSYTAERGAFEMRVAKGDLTFLPPMVMTIVTQSPELHFEYLGDFNYVPPREPTRGANINLFT